MYMKKKNFILAALILLAGSTLFSSCLKNDATNACSNQDPALEATTIYNYIDSKGYGTVPVSDTFGIKYQILDAGSSAKPIVAVTDSIDINYNAVVIQTDTTFSQNTTIRSTTTNRLPLVTNLAGTAYAYSWTYSWYAVIYHLLGNIGEGAHLRIYTPSAYAFGCNGVTGAIPKNAPLYFDLTITKVYHL